LAHGYALMGKAQRLGAFIPSLIGVLAEQDNPGPLDMYFVRYDIDDLAAGMVTAISATRWVNYDSLPANTRDPILDIPASELLEIAVEIGDVNLKRMLTHLGLGELA